MKAIVEDRKMRDLRGVGKSIEKDFARLGVKTVQQLAGADGLVLYAALNKLTGVRQDACVLDTFRCAVAQARDRDLPAEQRDWWWWSRRRKQNLV